MKTETLRGAALVHKIRELESKHIPIRSVTVGRTNSEWIVEHDNPPQENLKLNLTTVNQKEIVTTL